MDNNSDNRETVIILQTIIITTQSIIVASLHQRCWMTKIFTGIMEDVHLKPYIRPLSLFVVNCFPFESSSNHRKAELLSETNIKLFKLPNMLSFLRTKVFLDNHKTMTHSLSHTADRMIVSAELTWVCPDVWVFQRAASVLILLGDCSSDPALSGVRGLNSEPMTEQHNLLLSPNTEIIYNRQCSC